MGTVSLSPARLIHWRCVYEAPRGASLSLEIRPMCCSTPRQKAAMYYGMRTPTDGRTDDNDGANEHGLNEFRSAAVARLARRTTSNTTTSNTSNTSSSQLDQGKTPSSGGVERGDYWQLRATRATRCVLRVHQDAPSDESLPRVAPPANRVFQGQLQLWPDPCRHKRRLAAITLWSGPIGRRGLRLSSFR